MELNISKTADHFPHLDSLNIIVPTTNTIQSHTITTHSAQETKMLAGTLSRHLKKGHVVLFVADLGAGKTTFVQGVLTQLGVQESATSPTFVMAQTFPGHTPVHHLDFYRLSKKEILDLGLQDYLSGAGEIGPGLVFIEWADRCPEIWPSDR